MSMSRVSAASVREDMEDICGVGWEAKSLVHDKISKSSMMKPGRTDGT